MLIIFHHYFVPSHCYLIPPKSENQKFNEGIFLYLNLKLLLRFLEVIFLITYCFVVFIILLFVYTTIDLSGNQVGII